MGSYSHTIVSLAWKAVTDLTDRPRDILRKEWGVDNWGSGSPVERHLHGYLRTLTLVLEEGQSEITAYVEERARVRRFRISSDESGMPMLTEQSSGAKSVREVLDDLVSWLKGK